VNVEQLIAVTVCQTSFGLNLHTFNVKKHQKPHQPKFERKMVSFQIVGEKERTFQQGSVLIKHWVMCYSSCFFGQGCSYVLLFSCSINNY